MISSPTAKLAASATAQAPAGRGNRQRRQGTTDSDRTEKKVGSRTREADRPDSDPRIGDGDARLLCLPVGGAAHRQHRPLLGGEPTLERADHRAAVHTTRLACPTMCQ